MLEWELAHARWYSNTENLSNLSCFSFQRWEEEQKDFLFVKATSFLYIPSKKKYRIKQKFIREFRPITFVFFHLLHGRPKKRKIHVQEKNKILIQKNKKLMEHPDDEKRQGRGPLRAREPYGTEKILFPWRNR